MSSKAISNYSLNRRIWKGSARSDVTGDDDGIANDVGLVYAKQPFVICFLCTHSIERDFEIFIRQTAWDIFKDCGGAPEA